MILGKLIEKKESGGPIKYKRGYGYLVSECHFSRGKKRVSSVSCKWLEEPQKKGVILDAQKKESYCLDVEEFLMWFLMGKFHRPLKEMKGEKGKNWIR